MTRHISDRELASFHLSSSSPVISEADITSLVDTFENCREEGAAALGGVLGMAFAIHRRVMYCPHGYAVEYLAECPECSLDLDPLTCVHGFFDREPCPECEMEMLEVSVETCEARSPTTGEPMCSQPATHLHEVRDQEGEVFDEQYICEVHAEGCVSCRPLPPLRST